MYEMHQLSLKCEINGNLMHFLHVVTLAHKLLNGWILAKKIEYLE